MAEEKLCLQPDLEAHSYLSPEWDIPRLDSSWLESCEQEVNGVIEWERDDEDSPELPQQVDEQRHQVEQQVPELSKLSHSGDLIKPGTYSKQPL